MGQLSPFSVYIICYPLWESVKIGLPASVHLCSYEPTHSYMAHTRHVL